ncbi:MAG: hypothetical protein LBV52_02740 [Spirochaetaceae bacterium]|jgi:hypothetical protein|nr:hypothetical protein [Spirochaetaceae bacterium]
MKKTFAIFVILFAVFSCSNVFAQQDTKSTTTETEYEFPQWAKDLRRGEIIAFGLFPFSWLIASTFVDIYRSSIHNWDSAYYPWPLKAAGGPPMTNSEYVLTIGAAAGISVGLALVDALIITIKRWQENKRNAALPVGEPIILRRPMEGSETAPNEKAQNNTEEGKP